MLLETAHADMIHDAQFDYYGKRVATCSSDTTVKIFKLEGEQQVLEAELRGHEGPVWQVAWAHPKFGNILASCSYDGTVVLWIEESPGTWSQLFRYEQRRASINSVAFAPHEYGLSFACASSDGYVAVLTQHEDGSWEEKLLSESADSSVPSHNLGANTVSWAPAVQPGALFSHERSTPPLKRLASGGCDNVIKIWCCDNTGAWKLEGNPLVKHMDWVRGVAWAPSIGLSVHTIASCSQDKTVVIWTQDESSLEWSPQELVKMDAPVWSVSWSFIGNILAVSSGDSTVSLWKEDVDGTWRNIQKLDSPIHAVS
ncbi:hypothetical protein GpartN1_g1712.t1 [Galdieria partita]|uniref:Protein transport protein SEC13 n=1 Tax=Galdieria partita TaxID=83374 RepID=A0A9C7PT44_9RHOD|nr:hypothetical protein GpartN1_g1712.t1 [Galdieria partita]